MTTRIFALLAIVALQLMGPASSACASQDQAVIVVGTEDGSEKKSCIEITSEQMSGIQALRATGLDVVTKDFGGTLGEAVCAIGDTGRDSGCPSGSGYWHYWIFSDAGWVSSELGPSSTTVKAGDHQGWMWTQGGDPRPPRTTSFACPRPEPSDVDGFDPLTTVAVSVGIVILAAPFLYRRIKGRDAD